MDYIDNNDSNFKTYLYAATAAVSISGLYVAYLYITKGMDIGFDIEWKFWNSTVLWPILSFIGFFLQFIDWQHTSFDEGWVVKDSWGNEKFVKNNDIMSVLFGNCIFPLLMHFLIIPGFYGALLYYVIMIPLGLVNAIIPYLAIAVSIASPFVFYKMSENYETRNKSLAWLAGSMAFSLLILWLISLPTTEKFASSNSSSDVNIEQPTYSYIGVTTVKAKTANLRTGPGTSYDYFKDSNGKKIQVNRGDKLYVYEVDGDWFKIEMSGNEFAYIKKSLCEELSSSQSQEEIEDPGFDNAEIEAAEKTFAEQQAATEAETQAANAEQQNDSTMEHQPESSLPANETAIE